MKTKDLFCFYYRYHGDNPRCVLVKMPVVLDDSGYWKTTAYNAYLGDKGTLVYVSPTSEHIGFDLVELKSRLAITWKKKINQALDQMRIYKHNITDIENATIED